MDENKLTSIVGVFAHPDDEFIIAGFLVRAISKGTKVHLICATRGEAGKIHNPIVTKENMKEVRTKEIEKVCDVLGVSSLHFLDLPDGESDTWIDYKPIERIIAIFNQIKPDLILTFDRNGGNGHPDHKEISRLTKIAYETHKSNEDVRLYHVTKFPHSFLKKRLWMLPKKTKEKILNKLTVIDSEVSTIVKLNNKELKKKLKIIDCYKSQFPDEKGRYYKLPYFVLKRIAKYECYEEMSE